MDGEQGEMLSILFLCHSTFAMVFGGQMVNAAHFSKNCGVHSTFQMFDAKLEKCCPYSIFSRITKCHLIL